MIEELRLQELFAVVEAGEPEDVLLGDLTVAGALQAGHAALFPEHFLYE